MKAIWKFPIPLLDEPTIDMPRGAVVLSVGLDPRPIASPLDYRMAVWAIVDPEAPVVPRRFAVKPTGGSPPTGAPWGASLVGFVGTVVDTARGLAWHVWVLP